MARKPDEPGKWRVRDQTDGRVRVSGMKKDGTRFKQFFATRSDADVWIGINLADTPQDEWGLPLPATMRMSADTAQKMNGAAGMSPPAVQPSVDKEKEEKDKKKKEQANSLAELLGFGWAAGTTYASVRIAKNMDLDPVKPNPKQVSGLADATTETIRGWFGDREIKPWQMMILLTLALPTAMVIQSPKREKKPGEVRPLKSVP